MRRLILFLVALTCLIPVFAQRVDTAKVYHLPGVTVTEKYQLKDVKYAAPTQSFNSMQLKQLNAIQLSDAVKHFAGVNIKDYGGIGGLKTISVRSLGAEHTAVSYDGISITDFQTGQIDLGRFSLENVDYISLSVGQNNSIFQPARLFASASVLNISTLTPQFLGKRTFNASASFKTGSWGLVNPNIRLAQKLGSKCALTATGEWMSSDGKYPFTLYYTNQTTDMSSHERRNNTEVRNLHLESEFFANLKNNEQIRLKVYFYNSSRGLPGATTYYYNHSAQHLWDKNVFVQGHYQREIGPKWALQASTK